MLTDTVKRGEMVRNVRGLGTLVPEVIRWIPAETAGRVERILVRPGATVTPDTIVLELSNPSEAQALADLEGQKRGAEAELTTLRARIENELVSQEATVVSIDSDYRQATLQATADAGLAKKGLKSSLETRLSAMRAEALNLKAEAERKRLAQMKGSVDAQLAVQQLAVERMGTQVILKQSQVGALKVRAGIAGVLQLVPVEVGQQVAPGTNLARVANPGRLKAELKIPETQAKDVQIGQVASIDTRNGLIAGRVVQIDPAVVGGTVTVDVSLEGEFARGARPDLSVDGTIELERLPDVLYTGRPALGEQFHHAVPDRPRRLHCRTRQGGARAHGGQCCGSSQRTEGRRPSCAVRHIHVGHRRSYSAQVAESCRWPAACSRQGTILEGTDDERDHRTADQA